MCNGWKIGRINESIMGEMMDVIMSEIMVGIMGDIKVEFDKNVFQSNYNTKLYKRIYDFIPPVLN